MTSLDKLNRIATDWPLVSLGQIVTLINGRAYGTSELLERGTPILRIQNLNGGNRWYYSNLQLPAEKYCDCGDLLFAWSATFGPYIWQGGKSIYHYHIWKIVPGPRIDKRFAFYLLQSITQTVKDAANGVAMLHITKAKMEAWTIALPPLVEQKRIAGILDAADALRAKRREALAQLDILLQATFHDMFGDPVTNSKKLPIVPLGDLGEWRSGGTPSRTNEAYFNGTIPWFSSGELNSTYVTASAEHITSIALAESAAKMVQKGALMLGMYDTAALKASIAGVNCACNQAIAFATITPTLAQAIYVHSAILIGREHFRRLQRGVRQKNLSLAMIKEICIPLPTLDEQSRYASRIASLEQLRETQLRALAELDTLFASLQSRAFRGEL